MDLIDSYVQSVRLFLPKEQRDDIARELREDLRSQVEDKQAELGRPPTRDEQVALLRQYGHPMLMAARYRRARNLIGPVIFPIYLQVLKLVLALVTVTHLASIGVLVTRGASLAEVGGALTRLLDSWLNVAVFITLAAACVEWSLTRFKVLERWNPNSWGPLDGRRQGTARVVERAISQVNQADSLVRRALDEAEPPRQARSFAEFVMLAVFACWGVLGLKLPSLIFANAASMLDWAPMVDRIFPIVVIVVAAALVEQYLRLTRPGNAFARYMRVFWANVGWLLLVLLSLADRQWVVWTGTPEQWVRLGQLVHVAGRTWSLVDVVNGVLTSILVLVALATLAGPCWRLRRILSRRDTHTAHA
jgi:hypothetical protein